MTSGLSWTEIYRVVCEWKCACTKRGESGLLLETTCSVRVSVYFQTPRAGKHPCTNNHDDKQKI